MVGVKRATVVCVLGVLTLAVYLAWRSLGPTLVEGGPTRPRSSDTEAAEVDGLGPAEPEGQRSEAGLEESEGAPAADDSGNDREAAPVLERRLRGPRIVYASTGDPLPDFRVDHHRGDGSVVASSTDEDGYLPAPMVVAHPGEYVQAIDHPELAAFFEGQRWDLGEVGSVRDGTLTWRVRAGPTFTLDLVGDEGRDASGFIATLAPWDLAFPTREDQWTHAPVREGALPWVRFGWVSVMVRMQEPPTPLLVRSRDGLLLGEGVATRYEGVEEQVVKISLHSAAALRGVVEDSSGSPVAGVLIDLEHEDRSLDPIRRRRQLTSAEDGSFLFGGVLAGPHELGHRSKLHDPHAELVELVAGVETFARLVLIETPRDGKISGRITSETGSFHGSGHVRIVSGDGRHRVFNAPVDWAETAAGWVGRFELSDLPLGDYNVSVRSDSWYRFEPPVASVGLPSEATDFLCRDAVPKFDLSFDLKDAETGDPIDEFQFTVEREGGRGESWGARRGETVLPSIPKDTLVLWSVRVAGYKKVYGDTSDFQRILEGSDPEHRVCDLELRRGWAERLIAFDNQERQPVAGVTVLLDGEPAGTTDAHGRVDLEAEAAPEQITIASGEYFLVGGDVDRETGRAQSRFGQPLEIIVVRLR